MTVLERNERENDRCVSIISRGSVTAADVSLKHSVDLPVMTLVGISRDRVNERV